MNGGGVQFVLLVEDRQHEAFLRRFLEKRHGVKKRAMRVKNAPNRGSAEQFVRDRFVEELRTYRQRAVRCALIVMIDGDKCGRQGRLDAFRECCAKGDEKGSVDWLNDRESVIILVPQWNIEAWLAYLDGKTIDESKSDYPRLDRERKCDPMVENLVRMCRNKKLVSPAPNSLVAACEEYSKRLKPLFE